MAPQFQQNEVGFERRVGREIGPPVTLLVLNVQHVADSTPGGLGTSGRQRIGDLEAWAHMRESGRDCTVRANSTGRLKRTSSSLISISSS